MSSETFDCGVDDKYAKKSSGTIESRRRANSHPVIIIDWSGTNTHTNSDLIIDLNGRSRHTKSNPEVIDESGSSIISDRQTNVISKVKSGKRDTSNTQINGTESIPASARKVEPSTYNLQMDTQNTTTSGASKFSSNHGTNYASSSESSVKSEVDIKSIVAPPSFQAYSAQKRNDFTATSRPPVQVMDRSSGYDASRIPSSIFEKPANPLDWSCASNESLFSLNVGNVSFNRDHVFLNYELSMPRGEPQSEDIDVLPETPSFSAKGIHSPTIEEINIVTQSNDEVESLQIYRTSTVSFMLEEMPSKDQYDINGLSRAGSRNSSASPSVEFTLTPITGTSPKQSFAFPA
ncbi:hypothetical protein PIB30_078925 [Stylosanthes scabra]|uniref:Uncharacterized protein n=1 Tax=Stylosanthes scabra TaxID=79078 RepID=A0ABU6WUD1_9FABA|nr:hypothetical protein [Stylosanthes scabra]